MTDKEQINNFAKDINVPRKEQIIIDGIDVSGCEFYVHYDYGRFSHGCSLHKDMFGLPVYCDIADCCEDCYFKQLARKTQECEQQQKTLDELIGCVSIWEGFTEEESKLAKDSSIADLIMLLRKKTQECEKLEDFRTLVRELFTFGDSDVDDEHFIKYLKEDCKSSQEALDGYCRLTDITGIDYTVHGGADIEEIVKRVDSLKHECEELKKANIHIDNNRKCKAIKLMEIEKLIISCMSGYTDKFTQEIMDIIRKPEPVCFENKYEQALDTVSEYIKDNCYSCQGIKYGGCEKCELKRIKDIINKAKEQL